ncbi:hypothetical protein ACH429_13815 [Streptomyces pathocidini]|uniref:Uncharacterized protein n=1 Tax=Streptomyces pathocidini TaxID=1650571 RepID=A0ABW7URC3_9ACTN|nr:hypothetical protein [Streptomyces pathocidini]
MGRDRALAVRGEGAGRARGGAVARDRELAGEAWAAGICAALLLAVLVFFDFSNGTLTPFRAVCWMAIALGVLAVLLPVRVTAGEGWLSVRGLVRERAVRTDQLVLVRRVDGMAPRLVLRDASGNRVEFDPKVLGANPLIWHLLDTGVRRSRQSGLLRGGTDPLRALSEEIDGRGARSVFDASGLR